VRAPVAQQSPGLAAPESVAPAPQAPVDLAQPAPAGESAGEDLPLTLQALIEAWPAVVATLRSENAMLGAVVEDAEPVELNGSRLVLAFAEDAAFLRRKAEDRASRTALSDAVTQVTGRSLSLDYALREPGTKLAPENLSDEELVRRFKVEFDGEELRDDDDNSEETP
jgi:DNA polymerase-3 subunit gamma/tau